PPPDSAVPIPGATPAEAAPTDGGP
ncbi:virulence factor Mce, partial [Mycobacterium marinum]